MTKSITCFGSGSGLPGDPYYEAMTQVGRLLGDKKIIVLTGGFGGSGMEAPAKGSAESGGEAIGFTFIGRRGNQYLTQTVDCGREYARSSQASNATLLPEVQYGIRLGHLLAGDGFIVAANGGVGTMVELLAVLNFNLKFFWKPQKRVAILRLFGSKEGLGEETLDQLQELGIISRQARESILVVNAPEQAVAWVT